MFTDAFMSSLNVIKMHICSKCRIHNVIYLFLKYDHSNYNSPRTRRTTSASCGTGSTYHSGALKSNLNSALVRAF